MAKPARQKTTRGSRNPQPTPDDNITDPRFANIQTDPRFRLPSRKNTHVKIDKRFSHMLHDEQFSSKAKVDRYGRRLPKDSGKRELERLYRIEDDEDDEDEDNGLAPDGEVERELKRIEKNYDPARDGGFSESSSDESSSDEDDESGEGVNEEGLADEGWAVPVGEISSRIAIVNLDWDNIRAIDLMAVFASFAPDPGSSLKVSIYPSEFGKERMEKEETEGPPKEIFAQKLAREREPPDAESEEVEEVQDGEDGEDKEDEEESIKKSLLKEDQGEDFDSAKLRQYQLERLRYYYAVLTCSSNSVAEAIYNAVDGTEYLTTANFFDLRFIPDDMDFSDDKPRDECDRIPDGYRPNEFVTDALQHSKVKLTWDADDKARKEVQRRAFSGSRADIDENDLKAYLGTDSSEDDAPEPIIIDSTLENKAVPGSNAAPTSAEPKLSKKKSERQKMRSLLGLGAELISDSKSKVSGAPVGDMVITFSSGLSSNPKQGSVFENEPEIEETTAEKYVRKEKERKARRKEKMKAARNGTATSTADDAPKDMENPAEDELKDLGFDDPFFTAPEDDRAAATALRKEQKRQKRAERAAADAAASAQRAELELLMMDDDVTNQDGDAGSRSKVSHFDINEIAKAEKALKKKRRGKLSAREKAALEAKEKDDFEMDVSDPRFGAVFDQPEFAVDPSNPRFKETEGMKALLEESRRKRAREEGGEGTFEEGVFGRLREERMGNNDEDDRSKKRRAKSKKDGGVGTFEEGFADGLRMAKERLAMMNKEGDEKFKKRLVKSKKDGGEDLRKLVERVKGKTK